jgi:DNA repair photolyase
MELIEVNRKSRVIKRSEFGCLRDAFSINVTKGCEFSCVYCYARGYPEAPEKGEVHLYVNLPEMLLKELDNPRRRLDVNWVIFNTASDSFQNHPAILEVTYSTMRVLIERGIGFSFLTKGRIPDRFIRLFSLHPGLVHARIGLVSLSTEYRDTFEPNSATIQERLGNIERLKAAGIEVEVRIDPIIPFYTDDIESIERLYKAISERGVRNVSLSYLHLRPAILDQLKRELPLTEFRLIKSCYESQPWTVVGTSTKSKLVPLPLREKGYRRFKELAKDHGIVPIVCSCKNPDMPSQICSCGMRGKNMRIVRTEERCQLSLFPCL